MNFEQYVHSELIKPVPSHYDPKGNSARAVATRGTFGEITYQYKDYPTYLKWVLGEFRGVRTTLDWIISVPILIVFSPIIPIIWGVASHKRAIREYKAEYDLLIKSKTKLPETPK